MTAMPYTRRQQKDRFSHSALFYMRNDGFKRLGLIGEFRNARKLSTIGIAAQTA